MLPEGLWARTCKCFKRASRIFIIGSVKGSEFGLQKVSKRPRGSIIGSGSFKRLFFRDLGSDFKGS